jgi:purine-binding chemotaxis protein CheW
MTAAAEKILRQRAEQLARPRGSEGAEGALDLLVFRRGGESYAVEASAVVEVLRRTAPAPLPGSRAFLRGVVHHRESLVAVVDVRALLVPGASAGASGPVVIVADGTLTLGLLADEIVGVAAIGASALPSREASPPGPPWVRGTTAAMTTLLDVQGLVRDARVTVEDAAG